MTRPLTDREREAIEAYFRQGSVKGGAYALGISEGAMKLRLSRAKVQLGCDTLGQLCGVAAIRGLIAAA